MSNIKIMVENMTCTGCGECYSVCPHGYIFMKQGKLGYPVPHIEKCEDCGICLEKCPYSNFLDPDDEEGAAT